MILVERDEHQRALIEWRLSHLDTLPKPRDELQKARVPEMMRDTPYSAWPFQRSKEFEGPVDPLDEQIEELRKLMSDDSSDEDPLSQVRTTLNEYGDWTALIHRQRVFGVS